MTSYYVALGVPIDADAEEVRRAYLRKAQELHPDRHAASPEPERRRAEEEMKALNEAWATLKNPEARRRYDIELGLVDPDPDDWPGFDSVPEPEPPRRSPLRRTGVRLAIVVLLVLGLAGTGVALFPDHRDHSGRWSRTAVDQLRSAAVRAGMSGPQADCFVRSITRRYAPSDAVDRSAVEQTIDDCRSASPPG
ncbi:MAG: J domain-containing protein [Actinobacteria bacterium]|nr:J domain-containing protein [Actinomycetota bacterium]